MRENLKRALVKATDLHVKGKHPEVVAKIRRLGQNMTLRNDEKYKEAKEVLQHGLEAVHQMLTFAGTAIKHYVT